MHTVDEARGFPVASLSWASAELPEITSVTVDAPSGWLRVATTLPALGPDLAMRQALGLLYTQTGLGHVQHDAARGELRIAASLQAVESAPSSAALLATVAHLARIRQQIKTGQGDLRAVVEGTPLPGEPTLADAARALGASLSLVAEKDGSFVGGLHEPRSDVKCALRIHTPAPGIFAFDAWRLPPVRIVADAAEIERVDRFNGTLDAGALLLFPDGFRVYRWACPFRWLDVPRLATPVMAHVALDAFLRLSA